MAILLSRQADGLLTPDEEGELRAAIAKAGYADRARTLEVESLVNLGLGIIAADFLLRDA